MPRPHNHPHHHSAAERKARASRFGGLQLPVWRWGIKGPYWELPPGWETKSPAEFLGTAQGCRLLALLFGAIVVLFVVIVLLAQVMR